MKQYIAVVGDMVHSRASRQRKRLSSLILQSFTRLTEKHEWIAPPAGRGGIDEFSAVPPDLITAWRLIEDINLEVWPDRFRFGIGFGGIDVGATQRNVLRMDGEAFHSAKTQLLRAETEHSIMAVADTLLPSGTAPMVEAIAEARQVLIADWTVSGHSKYKQLRLDGHDARLTAAALNVSQQAIYAAARRGRFDLIDRLGESVASYFTSFMAR